MPRLALTFIFWCLLPLVAGARTPPATIWTLVRQASLVVQAEVEEVRPVVPGQEMASSMVDGEITRLRVLEPLRGHARPEESIEVRFFEGSACDTPPRYEVGRTVLTFLRNEGRWWTVAGPLGVRYPAHPADTDAFRQVLNAAVEAQGLTASLPEDSPIARKVRQDWGVLAARFPATRWDGLMELTSASLSSAQSRQLAHDFAKAPSSDRSFKMTLEVLRGVSNEPFDQAAVRIFDALLREEELAPWLSEAFDLLLERYGEPARPRPTRAAREGASHTENLQLEWTAFKQRHGLSPRLLPLPDRSQHPSP